MEGDDPASSDPARRERGWVARRPVGVGSLWRHGRGLFQTIRDHTDDVWEQEQELSKAQAVATLEEAVEPPVHLDQRVTGRYQEPAVEFAPVTEQDQTSYSRRPAAACEQHTPCWPFVPVEIVKHEGRYTVLEQGRKVKPTLLSPAMQRLNEVWGKDRGVDNAALDKIDDALKRDALRETRDVARRDLDAAKREGVLHYGLQIPPQIRSKDAVYDTGGDEQPYTDAQQLDVFEGAQRDAEREAVKYTTLKHAPSASAVDPPPLRFAAPLAMRVRVEERELPPDYVRVTTRATTVASMGQYDGLVNRVEDLRLGAFDLPVGLVTDPTSEAAVVPFPMTIPMIPQARLISRHAKRQRMVRDWRNGRFGTGGKLSGLLAFVSLPSVTSRWLAIPQLMTWGVGLAPRVALGAVTVAARWWRSYWLRVRPDTDGTEEQVYTYGSPSVNVFDDLLADLRQIDDELKRGDERVAKDQAVNPFADYFASVNVADANDRKGERATTQVVGPRVENLTGRARQLAEFLFPAIWYDPSPKNANNDESLPDRPPEAILQPRPKVANALLTEAGKRFVQQAFGTAAELFRAITWTDEKKLGKLDARTRAHNKADNTGMDGFYLGSHRSELRYDVEIGDSQHDKPIRMSIHAYQEAGLLAGRAAVDYDQLRTSFEAFTAEVEELVVGWQKRIDAQKKGMYALVPVLPVVVDAAGRVQNWARARNADNNPGNEALTWFRDRAVLRGENTDAEQGFLKLRPEFTTDDVRARLRELLRCDFGPRDGSVPSHEYEPPSNSGLDDDAAGREEFETMKASVPIQWEYLSLASVQGPFLELGLDKFAGQDRRLVRDDPPFLNPLMDTPFVNDQSAFDDEGVLQNQNAYFEQPGAAGTMVYLVAEAMLLPPQPNLKADYLRARHATLNGDTVLERRLPQLVKLKRPSVLGGHEPLRDTDNQLYDRLKVLGPVCRRAARFLDAEVRELVELEVEAVHAEQTRASLGREVTPAGDVGLPQRRRLQFVSLYNAASVADVLPNGSALLPPLCTPPTLPLGATLPDETARHLHAALRVMFGARVLTMEDVLGAREAVPDVVRSEARNAFASILVNCLLARHRASTRMHAHDMVESVVRQARRISLEAARLIKALYDVHSAAVLADSDELLRMRPEGPVARLALRHTGGWRVDWGTSIVVLRSAVWRDHVRAFADALAARAVDTKAHPALLPLLNVRTSWMSVRPNGPGPEDAEELHTFDALNVHEARRAVCRVKALLSAHLRGGDGDRVLEVHPLLRTLTLADLALARPVLWRILGSASDATRAQFEASVVVDDPNDADNPDNPFANECRMDVDPDLGMDARPVPRVLEQEELEQAWAARRVELPLRALRHPLETDDDRLDAAFEGIINRMHQCTLYDAADAATRRCRKPPDKCVYYVPVCCALTPDMAQEYDPCTGMQLVCVLAMPTGANSVQLAAAPPGGGADAAVTLTLQGSLAVDGRIPPHPLFFHLTPYPEGDELTACVALVTPLANATLSAASSATFGPFGRDDENAGSLRQVMETLDALNARPTDNRSNVARDERVDRVASALADARRVLILATDRIYQALLYTAKANEAGANGATAELHIKVAGLRITGGDGRTAPDALAGVADTDAGTDADQPQEAAQRQRQDVARTLPQRSAPFGDADADADAAARTNKRMLMLAAMVAHTLLRLPIGGLRQITTRFVDLDPGDQTLLDEATALYNRYATQLQVTHAHTVPLSELVSPMAAVLLTDDVPAAPAPAPP